MYGVHLGRSIVWKVYRKQVSSYMGVPVAFMRVCFGLCIIPRLSGRLERAVLLSPVVGFFLEYSRNNMRSGTLPQIAGVGADKIFGTQYYTVLYDEWCSSDSTHNDVQPLFSS